MEKCQRIRVFEEMPEEITGFILDGASGEHMVKHLTEALEEFLK